MGDDVRERLWVMAAILVLSAGASAGCAKARAQSQPELPPLAAPLPPARVLPPLAGGPIEGASTPPAPRVDRQPEAPRHRQDQSRAAETPRPEPKPADAPKTEIPGDAQRQPDEAPPGEPAPVLQLAPAAESHASEGTIRNQLTRASKDLSRVDYVALSADAKAQYDTAKRFMVLADQAIKDRNLMFAQTLADKAAAIAGVLSSR